MNNESDFYLPGDAIQLNVDKGLILIGPGLRQEPENVETRNIGRIIRATRSGRIRASTNIDDGSRSIRLDFVARRYIPLVDDFVIGIVNSRISEYYTIDINSKNLAFLPQLAFEGVTNRNRPNLSPGDLLFCKVRQALPDAQAELTCVERNGKANGMGLAPNDGVLLRVNPEYTRQLATDSAYLLKAIGKEVEFESTVGQNGRVWLKASDDKQTVAIFRLLLEFQHQPLDLKIARQRLMDYLIA